MHPGDGDRLVAGLDLRHDVEQQQRYHALAVRRALPDGVAAIIDRDGLDIVAPDRREVLHRMQAAEAAEVIDHVARDLALVERVAPAIGNRLQRVGEFRLAVALAWAGRPALRQEDARERRLGLHQRDGRLPVGRDARADRIAVAGVLDGGRQQVGQRHGAVVGVQLDPGIDRARDDDRMRRLALDLGDALVGEPVGGGARRRAARAVEADDLCRAARRIKGRSSRRRCRSSRARPRIARRRRRWRRRARCRRPAARRRRSPSTACGWSPPCRAPRAPASGPAVRDSSSRFPFAVRHRSPR